MVRTRYSPDDRWQIAKAGRTYSYRTVSFIVGCGKSTVSRYVRAFSEPLPLTLAPRIGRPPHLTQDDLALAEATLNANRRHRLINILPLLKDAGVVISESTLRRIIKRLGIQRYVAAFKPYVDQQARDLRIAYAKEHAEDNQDMWRRTIFCDESILRTNGVVKTWVSRKPHEKWIPECLAPRLFSTRKTVLVWAAIWHGGRSELKRFERTEFSGARGGVTAMDYRNQITLGPLDEAWKDLRTLWRGYGVPRILEDNCKVHTAAVNRDAGKKRRFNYLDHPPYSPDLNPIENAWSILKRELAKLHTRPTTPDGLFEEAQHIWMGINQDVLNKMVDTMPGRMQMVIEHEGYPINIRKQTPGS